MPIDIIVTPPESFRDDIITRGISPDPDNYRDHRDNLFKTNEK